jgi:hypothetical protein
VFQSGYRSLVYAFGRLLAEYRPTTTIITLKTIKNAH